MDANRAPATSDSLSDAIRGVRNFEAIFQIPATHQLVLVRSRSQGFQFQRCSGSTMSTTRRVAWWHTIEALSR